MLLPYRAKNPPERFPWFTIGLIVINVLVYALTTESFLRVQESVLDQFAISHRHFTLLRLLTHMFLHADPFHLIGNMLFLWIFGSAVEGRLGPAKFLGLYFLSGAGGSFLHDYVVGTLHQKQWGIGASGAIMGLAGAYLYMFPFATICVVWGYSLRWQLAEWHAQWVILYFLVYDLLYGMLLGADGVAHFAHLGGAAAGFALPLLLRERRDSEDASAAQAIRADSGGNYLVLGLHELESLMEANPGNVQIIMAFCKKAATRVDGTGYKMCLDCLIANQNVLLEQADPGILATLVLGLPESVGTVPPAFLLRLGGKVESVGMHEWAMRCYKKVYLLDPSGRDTEMALARLARLTEQTDPEKGNAAAVWAELLRLFPNGPQSSNAEIAIRRLGKPTIVFSAGIATGAEAPAPVPEGLAVVTAPPTVFGVRTPVAAAAVTSPAAGEGADPAAAPAAGGMAGLAPVTPWTPNATPAPPAAAPGPEPGYAVGDVSGITLRPIGSKTDDGS